MRKAEAQGMICTGHTEVVHSFADGWTIVRLTTVGDVQREGCLMRNCLRNMFEDASLDRSTPIEEMADALNRPNVPLLHSLRDEQNLPHLTWYMNSELVWEVGGYRNGKIKQKYVDRLNEGLAAMGMPEAVVQPRFHIPLNLDDCVAWADLRERLMPPAPAVEITDEEYKLINVAFCHQDDPTYDHGPAVAVYAKMGITI